MLLRQLLLLSALFTLGQATLHAQTEAEAKQKAYEAMVAAEKDYDSIDRNIKAMLGRKVVPGRDYTIIPVVPQSMYQRRAEAEKRWHLAAAAYSKFKDTSAKDPHAYANLEKVRQAVRSSIVNPEKFLTWLKDQNVELNHPVVRDHLLTLMKGNEWESSDVIRYLMQFANQAGSYRDDLLAFAKSDQVQKKYEAVRIRLIVALMQIDPTLRNELTGVTKNWFSGQSNSDKSNRQILVKALEGSKDPFARDNQGASKKDAGNSKRTVGKR